jgi:hypothetical protein
MLAWPLLLAEVSGELSVESYAQLETTVGVFLRKMLVDLTPISRMAGSNPRNLGNRCQYGTFFLVSRVYHRINRNRCSIPNKPFESWGDQANRIRLGAGNSAQSQSDG